MVGYVIPFREGIFPVYLHFHVLLSHWGMEDVTPPKAGCDESPGWEMNKWHIYGWDWVKGVGIDGWFWAPWFSRNVVGMMCLAPLYRYNIIIYMTYVYIEMFKLMLFGRCGSARSQMTWNLLMNMSRHQNIPCHNIPNMLACGERRWHYANRKTSMVS